MMTSQLFPHYDPTTRMALETAMNNVWSTLQAHDPLRDWEKDSELKTLLVKKIMAIAETGVIDPQELRSKALNDIPV